MRSGRLILDEPRADHYGAWSLLRETSRQHLVPFEPEWQPDELSKAAYRRRVRRYREDRRRGTGAAFFIFRASDRTLIGGVTLTNLRRGVTQSAAVGYWIGAPFVRQGYASDALALVLDHGYEDLGLNRIEAACMPSNRASIGVLERAGFQREGLARRYLRINGVFEDHLLFARLSDDRAGVERSSKRAYGGQPRHGSEDGSRGQATEAVRRSGHDGVPTARGRAA